MVALSQSLLCLSLVLQLLFSISVTGQNEEEDGKEGEDLPSCVSPDPIGFTALTPQQLKQEIRNAVGSSLSGPLQTITNRSSENEAFCSSHLVLVEELLAELNYSRIEYQEMFLQGLVTVMEGILKSRLDEQVEKFITVLQKTLDLPTSPSTSSPPTSSPPLPPLSGLPGLSSSNPALSCQQVWSLFPTAPSGYYWVAGVGSGSLPHPVQVYCSMQQTCGGEQGGWTRVAHIDMTNTSHSCPPGGNFVEWSRPNPPRRLCIPNSNASGCFSHHFPVVAVGAGLSKICGRIVGYQDGTPNAFFPFHIHSDRTINDVYVDGISLMHGRLNPTHIWTFAAGLDETLGHLSGCRCSHIIQNASSTVPSFVGQDYFCDTGSKDAVKFQFYAEDPLWDGKGCGPLSSCCLFNNPPWFTKNLTNFPAGGAVEMRVCRDGGRRNENIPFQLVELYVK